MKQLFTFVLAAMAFVACTQNDVEELSANRADVPETLTVGFEGGDTRIELNEALKTVWTEGDEVSVYFYSDANQKWQYQGETGERLGMLRRVDAGVATTQTDYVVVAYPYNTSYTLNRINANLIASLPAVQSYKEGSYGSEGNIMVAQSEFTQFSLKSVCGWLRVELTGEGQIVKSITLRGNAGEQVAGLIYVDTATAEATLASEMGEASDEEQVGGVGGGLEFDNTVFTEVTLDCGDGVTLGAEATAFYIALLPQTFEKGMTIEINYANGNSQPLVCENSITISRNHISPIGIGANVEVEIPTNQLWYTATALVKPYKSSAFNVAIVSNEWDETTGEGVITFDGELTTIGNSAFEWCSSLTSVVIPDSVTTIGDYAFCDCSNLAEFKGKFAADGGRCLIKDNTLIAYANASGTTYTIPDSVTLIEELAFAYCYNLTSVTIPDSVTTIGEWAFSDCISLTSVYCKATTPPSLGDYVFKYWDSGYVNIDCAIYVPAESVEAYKAASGWSDYAADIIAYDFDTGEEVAISKKLFYTATALVEPDEATAFNVAIVSNEWNEATGKGIITFDGELTTIGDYAFCDCDNLTSVTIPDSVTTIGEAAFAVCSNLAEFKGKFAADGGRCLIKDNAFIAYAEASGTEYTIPDSVTTIGNWAFYFCSSLTSVTIPDSVTTIGDEAFVECHSLTSITIGDSVTTIGDYAFYGCTSLTSVTIPNSVTTIGWYAFYYCTSLTSVTIPDSVTTIGEGAFGWCSSLTSVTIPDSVTTIGDGAFVGCSSLTSVTIPDSVTTIGDEVFADCSNLAEFKGKFAANGGRCLIKDNAIIAYAEASGTEYTIPDSVTTIGEGVFDGCESLTSVTIPDSVTTIGNYAFAYCDDLTSVYCKAPTPPTLGFYVFDDNASGRKIYVPAESVEAYKAATNWSEYAADIVGYDFE